ncbi:hypothetical protein F0241_16225 [Vibrio kanaloae]|nr:hypothetical protein [Vibrio kanaloae]
MERQCHKAHFQRIHSRLKRQNKTTTLKVEHNFSNPNTKPNKIAQFIKLKFSTLAAFFSLATNAKLSSEQRNTKSLHNTLNT